MGKKSIKFKGLFVIAILVFGIAFGAFLILNNPNNNYSYQVKTFTSYDELLDFLKTNAQTSYNGYYDFGLKGGSRINIPFAESDNVIVTSSDEGSTDYSTTNVQVEGVDEPDIVKTDGLYLYVLADQTVYILKANPADNATILSNEANAV